MTNEELIKVLETLPKDDDIVIERNCNERVDDSLQTVEKVTSFEGNTLKTGFGKPTQSIRLR